MTSWFIVTYKYQNQLFKSSLYNQKVKASIIPAITNPNVVTGSIIDSYVLVH